MNFSINTNMNAYSTLSNMSNTQNQLAAVSQQLSSGYRINKAADDAAGLAISQKMMSQINGLNQATQNAQDGISLIQTAEGALGQSQNILQRMRTLAVQASSDTTTSSDRYQIQKEVDQLSQELSQVSNTTQFNTMHMLTGQFSGTSLSLQVGANKGETLSFNVSAADATSLGVTRDVATAVTFSMGGVTSGTVTAGNGLTTGGSAYQLVVGGTSVAETIQLEDASGNAIGSAVSYATSATITVGDASSGQTFTFSAGTAPAVVGTTSAVNVSASTIQNATGSATNNWQAATTGGVNVLTGDNAQTAITTIDAAITNISSQRATFGALQNRLNYITSNLNNTSQNLSSAKSQITDVNMAQAMSQYSQLNVLQQAGVSMLAQANQQPQLVLKLLG